MSILNSQKFRYKPVTEIEVGDVMRQTDEMKWETKHYYYQAKSVYSGVVLTPIHDFQGVFVGNREQDCVEVEWVSLDGSEQFTTRYAKNATAEIATAKVDGLADLITTEQHEEAI